MVQPGRLEGEHLLSLLKMPSALAGRMAVAEASLQRLHGSPDAQQPGRAGAVTGSAPAAQQPAATHAPEARSAIQRWAEQVRQARSKARPTADAASAHRRGQHGATACRCASSNGASAGEQCLLEPFLGTGSPDLSLWRGCFRRLLDITSARQDSQYREDQESISSAQQCSALAQELRRVVSGLPLSRLGAATVVMTASMAAEIACREVSPEVSPCAASLWCSAHASSNPACMVITGLRVSHAEAKIMKMMVTVMRSPSRGTPSFRQAQYTKSQVELCILWTTDENRQCSSALFIEFLSGDCLQERQAHSKQHTITAAQQRRERLESFRLLGALPGCLPHPPLKYPHTCVSLVL